MHGRAWACMGSQERREVVVLLEHSAHGRIADDPLAVVGILQLTCFRIVPYCLYHLGEPVSDRECTERAEHLLPTFVLHPQQPGQRRRENTRALHTICKASAIFGLVWPHLQICRRRSLLCGSLAFRLLPLLFLGRHPQPCFSAPCMSVVSKKQSAR